MATSSWSHKAGWGAVLAAGLALSAGHVRAQTRPTEATPIEGNIFAPYIQWIPQTEPGELDTTLRLREFYDSNLLQIPGQNRHGTYTYAESEWQYSHQGPGRTWLLTYHLGGRIYTPQFSSLDQIANDVQFQAQQRLTSRMNVTFYQRWADIPTNGFAEPAGGRPIPMQGAADEFLNFLTRSQRTLESNLVFQYQPHERTTFVWGGNYNDLKFTPATFLHSRAIDAYGSLFHQFTQKQTFGFGYLRQWINYPGSPVHSHVDNFLGIYTNQLTPTLSLSVYGGPAIVHQSIGGLLGVLEGGTRKAIVGGASLTKSIGRNRVTLKFSRAYSPGSLFQGTTLRDAGGFNVSREFTRRLSIALGGNYQQNSVAGGFAPFSYKAYMVQPSLRYQLRRRLRINLSEGYGHLVNQVGISSLNRNVIAIGLEYQLPKLAVEK